MSRGAGRGSPLRFLGVLLAAYLAVPMLAFLVRFAGSSQRSAGTPGLAAALEVSVVSATISAAIIAVCGIPLAHWLARSTGGVAQVIGVLVQLPLALPPVMAGVVLVYLVGPYTWLGRLFGGGLTDSVTGIVLAQTFVAAPFLVIAARSAFASVDPGLEEVAATLGLRPLRRFWRVSLPAALPGIRAGLLLTWLRALGEYGATVLLAYNPHSLPVLTYVDFSAGGLAPTQAPTFAAIALALLAFLLSRVRRPRRLRHRIDLPAPSHPAPSEPAPVGLDIAARVGDFELGLAYAAATHRLAILGASGAGKSMTLRTLAGLLPADARVSLAGVPLGGPVEHRHVGYVAQAAGLPPHLSVAEQVLLGRHVDPGVARWWLDALRLDALEDRLPHQLSGGQRRRVALAQALARQPRVVLLDEPFAGLDAPVRDALRRELRRLQHAVGLSTVLVTHDPEEAALLADEVMVIGEGRLLQAGPVADVFARPASREVAALLGIANLARGSLTHGGIDVGGHFVAVRTELPVGTSVNWCVRPESVRLLRAGGIPATVLDGVDLGAVVEVTVALPDGTPMEVRGGVELRRAGFAAGERCGVQIPAAEVTLWPDPVVEARVRSAS